MWGFLMSTEFEHRQIKTVLTSELNKQFRAYAKAKRWGPGILALVAIEEYLKNHPLEVPDAQ